MAIYLTPEITPELSRKLEEIDELRGQIGAGTSSPEAWVKRLRRQVQATAYSSSTRMEGFETSDEDAARVVADSRAAETEGQIALECYLRAMQHVGVMSREDEFKWHRRVVLDLHFDACSFQKDKHPGAFREGGVGVLDQRDRPVYEGPPSSEVPGLVAEVLEWLATPAETHFIVTAAMTHLHLASIHPFEDGNGRTARILQSLVLAEAGDVSPEFGSIEEFIAENVVEYYAVLAEVQKGQYSPQLDATPWIEFCIDAHLEQARRRVKQVEDAVRRWAAIETLLAERGWPERFAIAIEQALIGSSDRGRYSAEADIALPTASGDFRRLLDAGLVEQRGRGRNIKYVASKALRAAIAGDPSRIDPLSRVLRQ
ncbi:MAG: Fic family protein [Solirubrobacterales bacterium]